MHLKQKVFENIVAKEEMANYEQCLLLPQCFQKSSPADMLKCVELKESILLDRAENIMENELIAQYWKVISCICLKM